MKIPNFFLVGAPRCGTTAMASYLKAHPDITISSYKEPHFFGSDLRGSRFTLFRDKEAGYQDSFSHVKNETCVPPHPKPWGFRAKSL